MTHGWAPEDADGPLYVPQAFEDEYRDEARRTVAASRRRRSARRRRRSSASWSSMPLTERLRVGLSVVHLLAALLVLFLSGLTRTWLVGIVLVFVVAVSLAASLGAAESVRSLRDAGRRRDGGSGSPR